MKKRGQIGIFILIGILILIGFSVLLYISFKSRERKLESQGPIELSELETVKNLADSCLDTLGKEAILLLGKQGLLYPEVYLLSSTSKIAYYYYKGQGFFPYKVL